MFVGVCGWVESGVWVIVCGIAVIVCVSACVVECVAGNGGEKQGVRLFTGGGGVTERDRSWGGAGPGLPTGARPPNPGVPIRRSPVKHTHIHTHTHTCTHIPSGS